eukprot:TRINITY_DN11460_c0_g1_i1.p1 TRINITY_DN11460_c0_g1~~TRINITY_DN11460_c0_g1_i1.p1  ORF type:complete len:324 (-),score=52.89 TRINITY_DN11460_c0_g1_i1:689-1636(-)
MEFYGQNASAGTFTPEQQQYQQHMQQLHEYQQMAEAAALAAAASSAANAQGYAAAGQTGGLVTTIFCSGLPEDMTQREFRNMFLFAPGFEASTLIYTKSGRPVGYARFTTPVEAQNAVTALHNTPAVRSSPASGTLRCELSNFQLDDKNPPASYPPPPHLQPPAPPQPTSFSYSGIEAYAGKVGPVQGGVPRYVQNAKGIPEECPPCDTLYITNLSKWTQEIEIHQLASQCPGLVFVKFVQRHDKLPIAFLKFADKNAASLALQQLKGIALHSTSGMPINVAFSKTELNLSAHFAPNGGAPRYTQHQHTSSYGVM